MITFYSEKNQTSNYDELDKQSSKYENYILNISAIGSTNYKTIVILFKKGISLIDSSPREILHVQI